MKRLLKGLCYFCLSATTLAQARERIVEAADPTLRPSWLKSDAGSQIRSRMVTIDIAQLDEIASRTPTSPRSFMLTLFDDVAYSVEVRRVEAYGPGRFVVAGTIGSVGGHKGSVIISVAGDAVQGYISGSDGRVFSIQYAGGAHEVSQINSKHPSTCAGAVVPPKVIKNKFPTSAFDRAVAPAGQASLAMKGGSTSLSKMILPPSKTAVATAAVNDTETPVIDVMILYTPAMLLQAGGEVAMEALAQLAIAKANQTFIDSLINAQARLVHTQMIDYTEAADIGIDLGALSDPAYGVPALRDQYSADVVHLLVAGSGWAGVAGYGVAGNSISDSGAYAVITGASVAPTTIYVHEFGHNLGCNHHRAADPLAVGAFDYSFGYTWTGTNGVVYQDVMAAGGADTGIFSNPAIIWQGTPAGVIKSAADSADNATNINYTAPIVAKFRDPTGTVLAPIVDISPDHLTFSAMTPIGQTDYLYLYLSNLNGTPLQISEFGLSGDATQFEVIPDQAAFSIPAGGSYPLTIIYAPNSDVEAAANLTFLTNDPFFDGEKVSVPIVAAPGPKFQNISTRMAVGTGDDVLIGGFIIAGPTPRKVLLRGMGPSLAESGVSGSLADPTLELFQGSVSIGSNDDWGSGLNRQAIANTSLAPSKSVEAAILVTLDPGSYTVILRGLGDTQGNALVEVYDLEGSSKTRLANISTRGLVDTGDNVMIGGFIVGGSNSPAVLVRAIGPSLADAGITDPLLDPSLELHDKDGALIVSNDNWRDTQEADITGTSLAPKNDHESAILAILPPDAYTAIVRGTNNTTGVALVEAYQLEN